MNEYFHLRVQKQSLQALIAQAYFDVLVRHRVGRCGIMLANKLNHKLDKPLAPVTRWLARFGVSPNMLTAAGAITSIAAAAMLLRGNFLLGGVLILVGGLFDLLDGALARIVETQSPFGSVLDSTVDRYSDAIPVLGLLLYYSGWYQSASIQFGNMVLCCVVIVGSLLVPYVRARAESLVERCDVGLAERAERIIIFAAGLIMGIEVVALWILAIVTHLTVIQRLLCVRAQFREKPEPLNPSHLKNEELVAPDAKSEL